MIPIKIQMTMAEIEPAFRSMSPVCLPLDTLCVPVAGHVVRVLVDERIEVSFKLRGLYGPAFFDIVEIACIDKPQVDKFQPPFVSKLSAVLERWESKPLYALHEQ